MKIGEYYKIYNFKRKHRSLKRRSPYQYVKCFLPELSDKHPFVFSDSLPSVFLAKVQDNMGTCLALDKKRRENNTFVISEKENRYAQQILIIKTPFYRNDSSGCSCT